MTIKLGDRIKEARRKMGLTQAELAERLDIAYPTLNKYEKGHRVPNAELLSRIANELKCNPAWLLTGHREYSDAEGVFRAAGEYNVEDPELMLVIDKLLEAPELKKDVLALLKMEKPSVPQYTIFEKEYIDKLLILLRYKDTGTVSAITQNIDTFLRVPAASVEPSKKKKGA